MRGFSGTSNAKGIAMSEDHRHVRRTPASVGGRLAVVAVALSVSLLPWLLAADDPAPQREANRRRLSEMTVAERQRLKENYDLYREMTPQERDRLRNLQREIDRDPELKAAFDEYQRWADTLSPVERHGSRQAQDPEARRQLIERFRRRPPPDEMFEPPPSDRPPNGPAFGQINNVASERSSDCSVRSRCH